MTGPDRDQSEWLTRKRLIDPKLKGCGWSVVPFDSITSVHKRGCWAIAEYPTDNGPADYALACDGTVLGIVEAKKLTLGPQGVLTQAERYARGLPVGPFDFRGLRTRKIVGSFR
jgi:type I restriction enzyme, R subunit